VQEYVLCELRFLVGICHLNDQEEKELKHICTFIASEMSLIKNVVM